LLLFDELLQLQFFAQRSVEGLKSSVSSSWQIVTRQVISTRLSTMIVTIDGPAGAGKSSVARALARRLGFRFLDTGAMYRAVALAALQRGVNLQDPAALADLLPQIQLELRGTQVLLAGADVTEAIRKPEVTQAVRYVADSVVVRSHLSLLQRQAAAEGSIVTEGRDQGTVVFPDAQCKFYLTASPHERARRRYRELTAQGVDTSETEVLEQQTLRDRHDRDRPVGRLERAADAIELCTDGLTVDQVIDRLETLVHQRERGAEAS
jgi:cytidylate kinase